MSGQVYRMYRSGCGLLLAALLAACSTAPMRSSGGAGQPYARSESTAPHTLPPGLPQFIDHSVGEEEISIEAMSLVGVPYRWGGNTPDSGFDCSGLVDYVVRRAAFVNLPRTTEQMESFGTSIEPDEISPGDLIFFNTTGRAHSHVGIYVGQYRFVNAPSTGGTVRIDYVTNPYWAKRFDGIRRVAAARRPFESPTLQAATVPAATPEPAAPTVPAEPIANLPSYGGPHGGDSDAAPIANRDASNTAQVPDTAPSPEPVAAEPDPIAQIANLSGAGDSSARSHLTGSVSNPDPHTVSAATPRAEPASPPPTADPIAGFANSNL